MYRERPPRPILASLCYIAAWIAALPLGIGIYQIYKATSQGETDDVIYGAATMLIGGSLLIVLVFAGLGQVVTFLSRTADATERAADALEDIREDERRRRAGPASAIPPGVSR